jgi:hypothetical protein
VNGIRNENEVWYNKRLVEKREKSVKKAEKVASGGK